jgi:hypothetical protein
VSGRLGRNCFRIPTDLVHAAASVVANIPLADDASMRVESGA